MEDVLAVYTRPYDPRFPQVCLDEASTQLLTHGRPPQPPQPGRPARQDYEYGRAGVANLFMCYEPLAGRRRVMVRDRRTKADWAWCIRELLEEHYPQAERVVLVLDNLNTTRIRAGGNSLYPQAITEIELSAIILYCTGPNCYSSSCSLSLR